MNNNSAALQRRCPVCGATNITPLLEISQIPIHCNLLWSNQAEARLAPRGDMQLGFCEDCAHVFNLAFNPALMEYTQVYENSLHFSAHFQSYAETSAKHLVERYDLRGKEIIEIGCGKGDFLILLCQLGGNQGIGFDPSYVPDLNPQAGTEAITFIQDFYSESYANYKADLICCRHVLEHISSPRDFLSRVRNSIGNRADAVVFFEVPNGLFTLRDLGIWDLIYEHYSYFSPNSLARLFAECKFDLADLTETFNGQFLDLEARPGEALSGAVRADENDLKAVKTHAAAFADQYRSKVALWEGQLKQLAQAGQRVVVWGAGSKGVTFLNVLKIQDQIEYVVDINPRKQGMYVAGTGQQIVPSDFLRDYQPDVVLVMNSIYINEIQQLTHQLDLSLKFMSV